MAADCTDLLSAACQVQNLRAAWERVRRNRGSAGVDRVTIERFEQNLERRLTRLQSDLRSGRYRPLPLRRVAIPKPDGGTRLLGVPTVRDRIAQTACLFVLEPIIEGELEEHTYAYRRGRSIHHAIYRVKELRDRGYRWVVDADIDAYFDSVDHALLIETLGHYVRDGRIIALIRQWLEVGVLEHFRLSDIKTGIPQGAPISPLLANLYLDLFDEIMEDAGYKLVRYADDFVVLCRNTEHAERARKDVALLLEEFRLRLDEDKTQVVSFDQGFKYLGAVFVGNLVMSARPAARIRRICGVHPQRRAHVPAAPGRTGGSHPAVPGSVAAEDARRIPATPAHAAQSGFASIAEALEEAYARAVREGHASTVDPVIMYLGATIATRRDPADRSGGQRRMDRFLEGSPLLPISSLGEYVYCPRLFFYRRALHVEAQTQEMLEGKVLHRDVDRPRVEAAGDSTRYYSVNVIAPILGLAGRLDMIEQRGDEIYPVEYKRGRGPASPGVRVQLCAEAMALEEVLGISVTRGYVEFFDSGEREAVPFDAKLRRKTLDAIVTGRSIASRQWVPRAVYGRRKCEPCSLRSTCLPWETMRLLNRSRRGEVEPIGDDLPDGTGVRPSQAE